MARIYFDKSIDFILRPEKRQYMLDKFCIMPEFGRFFDGLQMVEIFTTGKTRLEGYLTHSTANPIIFTNQTPGEMGVSVGDTVLLIPQQKPHVILVQAAVSQISDEHLVLTNLDPRRRARYRTRMAIGVYPLESEQLALIKSHDVHAFRVNEVSRPSLTVSYIGNVVDKIEDNSASVVNAAAFIGKGRPPVRAIMADLSEGGLCIYVKTESPLSKIKESELILVLFEILHPSKTQGVQVLASVRKKRMGPDFLILHCMFVDPLPKDFLNFEHSVG